MHVTHDGLDVRAKTECILITRIRAKDVIIRLRHIPVGFYVAVTSENSSQRTANKSVSAGKGVVEWDEEITLPSEPSSKISLSLHASFELGPMLGTGEVLRRFEITVGELLDGQLELVKLPGQGSEEVISPSSFEIEIGQRVYSRDEHTLNPPKSEEMHQLEELTGLGHRLLDRYRRVEERQDLDESIRHFELTRDICPLDHPSYATVLFNLATARFVYCRATGISSNLDVPINLYRDALRLRPRGHPDHPFTLLSLGIALQTRSQRQNDGADKEGKSLLLQVLNVASVDSHVYRGAVLSLCTTAQTGLTQIPQVIDHGHGNEERRILEAALKEIFRPDSSLLEHAGVLFHVWFDSVGDPGAPEKELLLEAIVRISPDDHPEKPFWLLCVGTSLSTRYKRSGDVTDLDKSISMFGDAVRLTPDDDPDKLSCLKRLAQSLLTRYQHFGNVTDMEQSISVSEDAVRLTPDGHPLKIMQINTIGNALLDRYERFGDPADLDRAVSTLEEALLLASDGHPERATQLNNLGHALLTRHKHFGDNADLERAISIWKNVVQLTPDSHPQMPQILGSLGRSLSIHYKRFGDVADLERAIAITEDAVRRTLDGHPDKPVRLSNLGHSLLDRYERFGDPADLKRSISILEDAVRLTRRDHPSKPSLLDNLGNSFLTCYEHLGNIADLKRSISIFEDAVGLTPDGHPDMATRLNNLSSSLLVHYRRVGDQADLERAISILEDVVRLTPDGHPEKLTRLENLGSSLTIRYHHFGDIADLERSLLIIENALRLTPDGNPGKPETLNNLGFMLLSRYTRLGNVADLDRSNLTVEDAVQLTPDDHPKKTLYLSTLGNALSGRYERFGDIADLEKLISTREEVVRLTPDSNPDKAVRLSKLSRALFTRYERFNVVADLERSISINEDALQLTPDGHPDRPSRLNEFGCLLSARYARLGDVADLERSIAVFMDIVELRPDGYPGKPASLGNLGDALLVRYELFRGVADLRRATSVIEDAVQLTPEGDLAKHERLVKLGRTLENRYECFGDIADLERSISVVRNAVQSMPDGFPHRSSWLNYLAHLLLKRTQQRSFDNDSDRLNLELDFSRVASYFSQSARSQTSPSLHRFEASRGWIKCVRLLRLHFGSQSSLLDAYAVAVHLLPQLAWMGFSLQDRYHQLLDAAGGPTRDAAAAALEAHQPELAIEWLEQGRSVMWGQLSQLRTPVDDLRVEHPELALQFERVSQQLEKSDAQNGYVAGGLANHLSLVEGSMENLVQKHQAFALTRERLLAEIRAKPGFERFLLPKTIGQLSILTHSGPVVFLNASKHGCDALAVTAGPEQVVHVSLSNIHYNEVADMKSRLNESLRANRRVIPAREGGVLLEDTDSEGVFESILPSLWSKVVSPILAALAFPPRKPGTKLPRIFWCLTGPFAFLPIHAAGLYDRTELGSKLSDFAISSYIPAMSALELPPQKDSGVTPSHVRLLAVRQPSTDGQPRLAGAKKEVELIQALSSSSPLVRFDEADGTVKDVLSKMAETDWVHFACHGVQDRASPLESGLLLAHGKRLMLSDIVRLSHPRGGLAFLSACQTATGDEQLSDEAVHLAAGMLLAGYKGVIATMWSIMDGDAPRVAEDVYRSLFRGGDVPDVRCAAEALHRAIERLRDSGAPFLSWVPFIHVGL